MMIFLAQFIAAHLHDFRASTGPDGVIAWIQPPHVAAGLGFNWSGRCAGLVHYFQVQR